MSDQRVLMGTYISITVATLDRKGIEEAIDQAFDEIKRIESMMNFYDESSQLSCLNRRAPGGPTEVPNELFSLIEKSLSYSRLTSGAFDITATSLGKPGGYKNIVLNKTDKTIYFKNPQLKIDLGGVAKGYAVDRTICLLRGLGIENALVDAGGDIRAIGSGPRERYWQIAIQDPADKERILAVLRLNDRAITTSGNYLRPHIVDPQTGSPIQAGVLSATILASDCTKADILATTIFVLGQKDGLRLVDELENVEGMIVVGTEEGIEVLKSKGFNLYAISSKYLVKGL